jgi:hypothetical protein
MINNAQHDKQDRRGGSSTTSESITLRFDRAMMDKLRNEAEYKMESVNTLLNQIVKSYTKWHKPARMAGLIYINKFLYRDIVEHLTEEEIKSIAENYARHYFMDIIEMFDGMPSVSFYIEYLLMWFEISGFNYKIDEVDPDHLSIKVQLDLGRKFSEFIAAKVENILEALNQTEVKIEATDHLVIVRISKPVS